MEKQKPFAELTEKELEEFFTPAGKMDTDLHCRLADHCNGMGNKRSITVPIGSKKEPDYDPKSNNPEKKYE
jgi:hypothetical protein